MNFSGELVDENAFGTNSFTTVEICDNLTDDMRTIVSAHTLTDDVRTIDGDADGAYVGRQTAPLTREASLDTDHIRKNDGPRTVAQDAPIKRRADPDRYSAHSNDREAESVWLPEIDKLCASLKRRSALLEEKREQVAKELHRVREASKPIVADSTREHSQNVSEKTADRVLKLEDWHQRDQNLLRQQSEEIDGLRLEVKSQVEHIESMRLHREHLEREVQLLEHKLEAANAHVAPELVHSNSGNDARSIDRYAYSDIRSLESCVPPPSMVLAGGKPYQFGRKADGSSGDEPGKSEIIKDAHWPVASTLIVSGTATSSRRPPHYAQIANPSSSSSRPNVAMDAQIERAESMISLLLHEKQMMLSQDADSSDPACRLGNANRLGHGPPLTLLSRPQHGFPVTCPPYAATVAGCDAHVAQLESFLAHLKTEKQAASVAMRERELASSLLLELAHAGIDLSPEQAAAEAKSRRRGRQPPSLPSVPSSLSGSPGGTPNTITIQPVTSPHSAHNDSTLSPQSGSNVTSPHSHVENPQSPHQVGMPRDANLLSPHSGSMMSPQGSSVMLSPRTSRHLSRFN